MDAVKYFKEKRRILNSLGRIDGICTGVNCSRLQDFLEKYPNAELAKSGTPFGLCPFRLGFTKYEGCYTYEYNKCFNCWNRPIEG